jgi:sugar lactone lactonase YvrE
MPQNTTPYGRQDVAWPDLGSDPGSTLHGQITSAIGFLSNNVTARWSGELNLANNAESDIVHNFGSAIANLKIFVVEDGVTLSNATKDANYLFTFVDNDTVKVKNISGQTKVFQAYIYPSNLNITNNDLDPSTKTLSQIAGIQPTLDLIFDSKEALNPVTFVRDSQATYIGEDGYLKIAKEHEPRIEHDPITSELKGLLIEEQRSNLFSNTERLDSSAWTKVRSSIVKDVEVAPDGSYTADKLIDGPASDGTTSHYISQSPSLVSGTTYTYSIFAKAAERTRIQIRIVATTQQAATFSLDAGTSATVAGSPEHSIIPVGNGWYKCSLIAPSDTTGLVACVIRLDTGTTSYEGDGKSGLYLWGAQLEAGAFPTSYIPSLETFEGRSLFNSITYASKSFIDTATYGTASTAIEFSPDGTKMYVANSTKSIYQYTLGTAWDVSTATYASKSFTDSGAPSNTYVGFRFNNDGTKAYRMGWNSGGTDSIRQFSLSTAYDISTASYFQQKYLSGTTTPLGMCFSPDGTKLYFADAGDDKVYQYQLSVAWDISTAVKLNQLNTPANNPWAIDIDSSGTTVLVLDGANLSVITLSVPWDISTGKQVKVISFSQDTAGYGISLKKDDNSKFYLLGTTTETVYQYNTEVAGTATYYDKNGVLVKTDNPGLARLTYNPDPALVHLAPKLLLEPARTNLFLQSEDFSTTWSTSGDITITTNNTLAPDGNNTADKIEKDATAFRSVLQGFSGVLNSIYTVSFFVKPGTLTQVSVLLSGDGGTTKARIVVDLLTGVALNYSSTHLVSSSVHQLQNGWFRVSMTGILASTSFPTVYIYPGIYSDTTAGYIYLWGAQLEEGYGPTSYIPTTDAAKTRSADSYTSVAQTRVPDFASMTGANFSDWYNQDEGTVYTEANYANTSSYCTVVNLTKGGIYTVSDAMRIIGWNDGTERIGFIAANNVSSVSGILSDSTADITKRVFAFAQNSQNFSRNGSISTDDTSVTLPLVLECRLGATSPTGFFLNGHIRRLAFFPERLSNEKIQAMTSTESYSSIPTATKYRAGLMPNLSNEFDELVLTGNTLGSNISDIVYTGKSFAAGAAAGDTALSGGPVFSPDGRKMFISSTTNDTVFQYTLGIPWEVASASYEGVSFSDSLAGGVYGVMFSNDGTQMVMTWDNNESSYMRLYTLSTPWDVGTAVYASKQLNLAAELIVPLGQAFSYDGLSLYIADGSVDKIYQYALSEAWDISTAIKIAEFALPNTTNSGMCFTADGRTMVVSNSAGADYLYIFKLSTPWDITTSVLYSTTRFSHSGETAPFSLFLRPGGENLYVLGGVLDTVYQYSCSSISEVYEGNKLLRGNSEVIGNQVVHGELSAANLNLKSPSQTTVGSAGGASALPATPEGYVEIKIDGVAYLMPYYAKP